MIVSIFRTNIIYNCFGKLVYFFSPELTSTNSYLSSYLKMTNPDFVHVKVVEPFKTVGKDFFCENCEIVLFKVCMHGVL